MLYQTVASQEKAYPDLLREIQDPPELLYIKGKLSFAGVPSVSIVGTRKASKGGARIAEEFASFLVKLGVVVTSGLAMGIDTSAHIGALRSGGITVAVLGTAIDNIYPASNLKLAEEILEKEGAIVSEYKPGAPSYRGNFLKRNRIISGLSQATLVIEAPVRSGSLATARFAAEQGREVFVVPGPIRDHNYEGSHGLIRDGAILASSPLELAEDMGWRDISEEVIKKQSIIGELSIEEAVIVELIKREGAPLKVDKLIELTKLEPRIVSVALASLIIKGLIDENATGYTVK